MSMVWVGVAGAGATLVGGGLSYMGQRDARKQAGASMDAQERANAANLAYQREADQTNWMRYLQSLGYNMGQNPNLPSPEAMPYVPTRLAPYMLTNRIVDASSRPNLVRQKAGPSGPPGGGAPSLSRGGAMTVPGQAGPTGGGPALMIPGQQPPPQMRVQN